MAKLSLLKAHLTPLFNAKKAKAAKYAKKKEIYSSPLRLCGLCV